MFTFGGKVSKDEILRTWLNEEIGYLQNQGIASNELMQDGPALSENSVNRFVQTYGKAPMKSPYLFPATMTCASLRITNRHLMRAMLYRFYRSMFMDMKAAGYSGRVFIPRRILVQFRLNDLIETLFGSCEGDVLCKIAT